MRLEPHVNTHPRLLRKASLADEPTGPSKAPKEPTQELGPAKGGQDSAESPASERQAPGQQRPKAKSRGSRFVGATFLDENQKVQIDKALKQKKIGDEMGRQIFIGAVEYQLSAHADQLIRSDAPKAEPPPRDRGLEQIMLAIEEQAHVLSELLLQIPKPSKTTLTRVLTAQDESGRSYDERYLCELGSEIDRLKRACGATAVVEVPEETRPDPDTSGEFVRKLAEAFSECFEQKPTADPDGPFHTCLEVLDQLTDYAIGHEPDFLARAMNDG